jgi:Nucleotide modification associated domain 3
MKVVFSRKGFDSAAGKAPSPIIGGEPISLPIPTKGRSETSYVMMGLGKIVERITKGRIGAGDLCHEDPMFLNGRWAFGQRGRAQSHLEKNDVGVGDVFLFFGLFASLDGRTAIIVYLGTWKSKKSAG